eukprot:scaffold217717_cov33-Tisochrysis_lutea.AAC.1
MESQRYRAIPNQELGSTSSLSLGTRNRSLRPRHHRREFRRYYVWLYSPKEAHRVPDLETTLTDRPLSDLDKCRMEMEGRIDVEETIQAIRNIGPGKKKRGRGPGPGRSTGGNIQGTRQDSSADID